MGETEGFFSRVVAAGSHQRAIRMVANGEVDASAIDSQVLAVELLDHPALAEAIQVIGVLGPSTIQPLVAAAHLPDGLHSELRAVMLTMHQDTEARDMLARGVIERFVPMANKDYDDIRRMLAAAEARDFHTIR